MRSTVFEVLNYRIEAAAATALGNRNGVHVEDHGDDTAFVTFSYLIRHVEDEGGVHTVVELHRDIHVVRVGVIDLVGTCDAVGGEVAEAERHQAPTYDICFLAEDGVGDLLVDDDVLLHAAIVIDCDGVLTCCAGVQHHGTGHAGEVAVTVDGGDAAVVVSQDDLRKIYIGNRLQQHAELFDVNVALGIVLEAVQVAVDLDGGVVGCEQGLGLVEGAGVARRMVARCVQGLVGVGGDVVERCLLVEVKALHAIERLHLVPHENIPVAPVEGALEGLALHRSGDDGVVGRMGRVGGVVAAQVEDIGLGVADLAEDVQVGLVPAVAPLCLPVVFDVEADLVVPIDLQL